MAYEPSEQIKEQIAKEYQNRKIDYPLTEAEAYIKADICLQLPTIKKALALYENRYQWQDKPDKTGWWWVFSLYVRGDPLIFPLYPIHILFCDGELHADTSYPEEFPSISNYIKTLSNPKWLYIPEPEPYKERE